MRINYDIKAWKGKQPVKVLEDKLDEYKKEVLTNLKLSQYENVFDYDYTEISIQTGPFAGINKRIKIEESFQAFIWIWSYCLMTLYDEGVAKPRLKQANSASKIKQAFDLLDYGYTLLDNFKKWDLKLPNPQEYDISDSYYIEKANGVYIFAMNELFLHEIGHIHNGDIDKLIAHNAGSYVINLTERKSFEYEADKFAFQKLIVGVNNPIYSKTIEFGIIAGFSALIMIQSSLKDYSGQYPDADERYKLAIESLNIHEEDNLWGIACLAWKLWSNKNARDLEWALEYETYKELFQATIIKANDFK